MKPPVGKVFPLKTAIPVDNTGLNAVKLKILIVEDDEISDMFLKIAVKKICREILHAVTGFEAVDIAGKNQDIDVILMDIKIPEFDGYETTRRIRAFNKEVIIIAQTAHGMADDKKKSFESRL
ncbi:MAG: response regulator [Bacteroidales bacterium]|nr:response regulator [Bacteroidales bacterium]